MDWLWAILKLWSDITHFMHSHSKKRIIWFPVSFIFIKYLRRCWCLLGNNTSNKRKTFKFVNNLSSKDPSIRSKIFLLWGNSKMMTKVSLTGKKIWSESLFSFIFLSKLLKQIFTSSLLHLLLDLLIKKNIKKCLTSFTLTFLKCITKAQSKTSKKWWILLFSMTKHFRNSFHLRNRL